MDESLRSALTADLNTPVSPRSARLTELLAHSFGGRAIALMQYGSHAHGSDARPESAHDFFVIVDRYRGAYRALAATVGTSYRPTTAALLNHLLPPNVISVVDAAATPPLQAKCVVLSLRHLQRACSGRAKDHFVRGRLFQQAQLTWTRDAPSRAAVLDAVSAARARTFAWVRSYLPPSFDAERYCRTLLETSFGAEIRPETTGRTDVLLAAQRAMILPMYDTLLQSLATRGVLARDGSAYADPHRPGRAERMRWAWYFRRSKVRATLRWLKYVVLYDDWLEYILRKVARRSGTSVELTPRERRWPLIFLWPKAIRFLRSLPPRRG